MFYSQKIRYGILLFGSSLLTMTGLLIGQPALSQLSRSDNGPLCNAQNLTTCLDNAPEVSTAIPASLAQSILADAAQRFGSVLSSLSITSNRSVTWPDSCRSRSGEPDLMCLTVLVDGAIATVEGGGQRWFYDHNSRDQFWWINTSSPGGGFGWREPIPDVGENQKNPILPDSTTDDRFIFTDVPNGRWFDPPTTYGFHYQMTSSSLFTRIMDFPVGIDADDRFGVFTRNSFLGEFGPGQSVDFTFLNGGGTSEFTIVGIDPLVDGRDPMAFPIKLGFNTPVASFQMQALNASSAAVPEPSSAVGVLSFGLWCCWRKCRNKK